MAKRRGTGEGSIWKEGISWRAAVTLDRKRVTRSFKTQKQALDWIQQVKHQVNQGLTYSATHIMLENFLSEWLNIHKTVLKPKSAERYAQLASDYIFPKIGNLKLKDLRVEVIENFYQNSLQTGVSVRNVRYVHSLLHRSLNDAVRRGLVGFNPAHGARLPRLQQREMEILDEAEIRQFLIAAQGHRHEVLFKLAIQTGMRQGELLGLRWSDLDWQRGTIRVQRQVQRVKGLGLVFMTPKTSAGRRTIQLGEEILQSLRSHHTQQQIVKAFAGKRWVDLDLIFSSNVGTALCSELLLQEFKVLLKKAGVKPIRFHDLRHSFASLALNHGIPPLIVSKVLGHSKPSTTLDIYGHMIPVYQDEVARLMDELVTPIPVKLREKAGIEPQSGQSQVASKCTSIARESKSPR